MVPASRQVFVVCLMLVVAAVLQGRVAHAIAIKGAQPDFPLVVLACGSTLLGGDAAVYVALWAGLLQSALLGMYVGSIMTSRTVAGAFAVGLNQVVIRGNVAVVPPVVAFTITLASELIFGAMVPPAWMHHARRWFQALLGESVYNAALAYPVYWFMLRVHIGAGEDEFGPSA
ncbi:MAG: rod shape-determining protein MreD [Capsulimonadaceae bacterium]